MKKVWFKYSIVLLSVLLIYLVLPYINYYVFDIDAIFDNYPWIKPIVLLLCGLVMIHNVRRDALASKQ